VTIKHKNNHKIVSTFGKTAWIFSGLINWYNVNKFDSPNTECGVGKGVKVSKLKAVDSRAVPSARGGFGGLFHQTTLQALPN